MRAFLFLCLFVVMASSCRKDKEVPAAGAPPASPSLSDYVGHYSNATDSVYDSANGTYAVNHFALYLDTATGNPNIIMHSFPTMRTSWWYDNQSQSWIATGNYGFTLLYDRSSAWQSEIAFPTQELTHPTPSGLENLQITDCVMHFNTDHSLTVSYRETPAPEYRHVIHTGLKD